MQEPRIIQGRAVTEEDLAPVRGLIGAYPDWHRTRVSRELRGLWDWTDAAGRSKDMACRTLLLELEQLQKSAPLHPEQLVRERAMLVVARTR